MRTFEQQCEIGDSDTPTKIHKNIGSNDNDPRSLLIIIQII